MINFIINNSIIILIANIFFIISVTILLSKKIIKLDKNISLLLAKSKDLDTSLLQNLNDSYAINKNINKIAIKENNIKDDFIIKNKSVDNVDKNVDNIIEHNKNKNPSKQIYNLNEIFELKD